MIILTLMFYNIRKMVSSWTFLKNKRKLQRKKDNILQCTLTLLRCKILNNTAQKLGFLTQLRVSNNQQIGFFSEIPPLISVHRIVF